MRAYSVPAWWPTAPLDLDARHWVWRPVADAPSSRMVGVEPGGCDGSPRCAAAIHLDQETASSTSGHYGIP